MLITTDKLVGLKAQLKFRKVVLHQIADNKAKFNFIKSVHGRKSRQGLSVDELKVNLLSILRQSVVSDQ